MPRVSVIIPTYNHERYILPTLESVFSQTYGDLEVIVVNDGSPDRTADVLSPLRLAGRIRYVEQQNAGQSAARNTGASLATGEYLAFLDDDDLLPPTKIAAQVAALDANAAAALAYGDVGLAYLEAPEDKVDDFERLTRVAGGPSGDVKEAFRARCWIVSPGATLIRASAFRTVNGFDPAIWGADDYDLYIRLADVGPFVYLPGVALAYRRHPANSSRDVAKLYHNVERVRNQHVGRFPWPPNHRVWWANRAYHGSVFAREALTSALQQWRMKHRLSSLLLVWLAVRLNPGTTLRTIVEQIPHRMLHGSGHG